MVEYFSSPLSALSSIWNWPRRHWRHRVVIALQFPRTCQGRKRCWMFIATGLLGGGIFCRHLTACSVWLRVASLINTSSVYERHASMYRAAHLLLMDLLFPPAVTKQFRLFLLTQRRRYWTSPGASHHFHHHQSLYIYIYLIPGFLFFYSFLAASKLRLVFEIFFFSSPFSSSPLGNTLLLHLPLWLLFGTRRGNNPL